MKKFALIAVLAASLLFAGAALANDTGDTAMFNPRGGNLGWVMPGGVEFEVSWNNSDLVPAGYVAMGGGRTSLTVKGHTGRVLGSAKRVRRGKWIVASHDGSRLGYAIRRGRKRWDAFEGREHGEHRYAGYTSVGPYGPQGVAVLLVFQARELEASTRFYAPNGKLLSTYTDPWYDGIISVEEGRKPGILFASEGNTPLAHARLARPGRWTVSRAADQGFGFLGSVQRHSATRWDVWHDSKLIGYIKGPNPVSVGLMELTTRYL